MKISICIPTYEMNGIASEFLSRSFNMLKKQTYKDFEVIVSDNSHYDDIKNLCIDPMYQTLNIKYFKNPRIGLSANTNESMKKASGELIKILYMDDYFANENSLKDIVDNVKGNWMVTGCGQDIGNGKIKKEYYPTYNKTIYMGKNTIGSPTVLTIKNTDILFFDENLKWLLDCDYYKRLYDKYGEPSILNEINVVIGIGKHQTTSSIKLALILKEKIYVWTKYNCRPLFKFLNMW